MRTRGYFLAPIATRNPRVLGRTSEPKTLRMTSMRAQVAARFLLTAPVKSVVFSCFSYTPHCKGRYRCTVPPIKTNKFKVGLSTYIHTHADVPGLLPFGPAPVPRGPLSGVHAALTTGFPEATGANRQATELSLRGILFLVRFLRRLCLELARLVPAEPAGTGCPEPAAAEDDPAPGCSRDCSLEASVAGVFRRLLPRGVVPPTAAG